MFHDLLAFLKDDPQARYSLAGMALLSVFGAVVFGVLVGVLCITLFFLGFVFADALLDYLD